MSFKGNQSCLPPRERKQKGSCHLLLKKHFYSNLSPPKRFQEPPIMFTCFIKSRSLCACKLPADRHSCTYRHGERIKEFLWRTKRTKSLWATNQRQAMEIKCPTFSQCAATTKTFQSHGGREDGTHNPLKESCLDVFLWSSSTPLHFTSTGSAVCQLPLLRLDS